MALQNLVTSIVNAYQEGEMLRRPETARLSPLGHTNPEACTLGSLGLGTLVTLFLDGSHPSPALDIMAIAACSGGILGVVINRTLAGWQSVMEQSKN